MTKSLQILLLALVPVVARGDDAGVALHIDPAADSPVVAVLPVDHPLVTGAQPVRDGELARKGWRYTEYQGEYTGYVTADAVQDDTLQPLTLVYASPNEGAAVLTHFEEGDAVQILVKGPWTTVVLSKPLVLYVEGPAQPELEAALAAESADEVQIEEPADEATEPAALAPIVDTIAETPVEEPASEEPQYQAAPVSSSNTSTAGVPPGPVAIPQFTEGRFVRSPRFFFRKPLYNWQLVDEDGKRIAYVDTSQMLLSGSIEALQGRRLIVYGSLQKVTGTDDFVIRAAHVR